MNQSDKDELAKIQASFKESMDEFKEESEAVWNGLTEDQRIKVFCAVSRRMYEGEIQKRGTYRYVLYDVFNFGTEAYLPAQVSGYLEIHNTLYAGIEHENCVTLINKDI